MNIHNTINISEHYPDRANLL